MNNIFYVQIQLKLCYGMFKNQGLHTWLPIYKSKKEYRMSNRISTVCKPIQFQIPCLPMELTEVPSFYRTLGHQVLHIDNADSYRPLTFKIEAQKDKTNFFTQMISSYSSIQFTNNNKHIIARDYLSIKVWDISKADKPISSIPIQESIKSKLCDIF